MARAFKTRREISSGTGLVLCLVFGLAITVIQTLESFVPQWKIRIGEPLPVTLRLPSTYFRLTFLRSEASYMATGASTCPGIIARGSTLRTWECKQLAKAYDRTRHPLKLSRTAGYLAINLLVILMLILVMRRFGPFRARMVRTHLVCLLLMTLLLVGAKAFLLFTSWPVYYLPAAIIPMLAVYFLERRAALVFNIVTSFWLASLINFDVQAFGIFLAQAMGAYFIPQQRRRPSNILKAGFFAGWVALALTLASTLLFAGNLDIYDDFSEHWDPRYSIWIASLAGGIFSGIISWALVLPVGMLLGELSRSKLMDLQDLDHPLLVKLREAAPGTWEHSRSEANLAEAAAAAIGANAQLVRVGAYFHDVGKMLNPEYFIENQGGGPNPHDEMDPDISADAIMAHVTDGVRILRKARMPEAVVDFVYTHHGTSLIEFFWHKNMAMGNPGDYAEKDFSHRGVPPFSKETGILMLIDAIEAAARTVEKPEKGKFEHLVHTIIFSKIDMGQLDNSGLSIQNLKDIGSTLVDTLVNIYHARIKYPWQTEEDLEGISTSSLMMAQSSTGSVPVPEQKVLHLDNGSGPVESTPAQDSTPAPAPAPATAPEPAEPAAPAAPAPAPAQDPAAPAPAKSTKTPVGLPSPNLPPNKDKNE